MGPAEWFEVELGSEWQAFPEGLCSPPGHRDTHEVASKAAQKPISTAARRSEDHTLLSDTSQKTYVGRFFSCILYGAIRILLNGPQDARPGKFCFVYA